MTKNKKGNDRKYLRMMDIATVLMKVWFPIFVALMMFGMLTMEETRTAVTIAILSFTGLTFVPAVVLDLIANRHFVNK